MIQAGDTVYYKPSKEMWYLLGVNVDKNRVCVAGYPPTMAELSDCELDEKGNGITEEERMYRDKEFGMDWD